MRCGVLAKVQHALYELSDHWYPDQPQIVGNPDLTLEGKSNGESSFIASCSSDRKFVASRSVGASREGRRS